MIIIIILANYKQISIFKKVAYTLPVSRSLGIDKLKREEKGGGQSYYLVNSGQYVKFQSS